MTVRKRRVLSEDMNDAGHIWMKQARLLEISNVRKIYGEGRELPNVIERSLIVCETDQFSIDKSLG